MGLRSRVTTDISFNPHRPVKAGAINVFRKGHVIHNVSILTGPLRPVLCDIPELCERYEKVSILTGPLRPVLCAAIDYDLHYYWVSILTGPLRPVLSRRSVDSWLLPVFQSSPAR